MVTMKELLGHLTIADVPFAFQHNLEELLVRVNKVRAEWGKPLRVTSGFRTAQDQARINPRVKASKHMIGAAVDFADPDGSFYQWLHDEPEHMIRADLYGELGTHGWVHLQFLPFGSYKPGGTRWFRP